MHKLITFNELKKRGKMAAAFPVLSIGSLTVIKTMTSLKTHKKYARIRDNQQCQICGDVLPVPYGRLEVHHIVHRCKGGTHELKNLVTLCDLCHAVIHDHMGPAWVGLSKFPIEKQEHLKSILDQAKEEFESYLRLPLKERHCIQKEMWSRWGLIK